MNELGGRLQELRKKKGLSQAATARAIGISKAQMSRYEVKGVQPPADILQKLAEALDTTVDFIISGSKDKKVQAALKDSRLLKHFKTVEGMEDHDKDIVIELISAFIAKRKMQQLVS